MRIYFTAENVCGSTQASICGANANCAIINDNATCICRSGFQEDPNDASSCIGGHSQNTLY